MLNLNSNQTPQKEKRIFCRNRSCDCSLTPADVEAGHCTQCFESLVAETFPLEQALMLSLAEIESRRAA